MMSQVNAKPNSFLLPTPNTPSIKTKSADPSIILFDDDAYPAIILEKLLFEDISGQELLSLVRTTSLAGAFVSNSIISNASDLAIKYNPNNIIYIPDSLNQYFRGFSINLFDKIPGKEIKEFGDSSKLKAAPNVYYNQETLSIEIIIKDSALDDQVEIESMTETYLFNDTIDEE